MQTVTACPKSILLAWDSSEEAVLATRHSMEFLTGCASVHVTLDDPVARSWENGEEPGSDMATFLTRHGVKVEVDRIASGGRLSIQNPSPISRTNLDLRSGLISLNAAN